LKIVISSFGSSGDFNPCLAIARALRQKGVDVIFLSNPYYEKTIINAGLRFSPAGEYFDVFEMIMNNPDCFDAIKGPKLIWNLVLDTVPKMYNSMKQLIEKEKPDLTASHILEYGGMLAARQCNVPYITLSPTPMGWFNTKEPGYLTYWPMPLPLRRMHARIMLLIMDAALRYSLKSRCKKYAINLSFNSLHDVYDKALLNLGLWSQSLRPAGSDDPPHSKICGFVRDEHIKDWPDVPTQISDLFALDQKPVVVGLGSGVSLNGDAVYKNTINACKQLNRSCLLVGKDLSKYTDIENNIIAVDFAPYGWVFPRSSAIIHHGGLNTTAESLRSGIPSLIIPHGYDQFDNAIRAEQMGVSRNVRLGKVSSTKFTSTLGEILNNTAMHEQAVDISKKICAEPEGANKAAEAIISIITNRSQNRDHRDNNPSI
jgi:rhamnosyltransferase subunit B